MFEMIRTWALANLGCVTFAICGFWAVPKCKKQQQHIPVHFAKYWGVGVPTVPTAMKKNPSLPF